MDKFYKLDSKFKNVVYAGNYFFVPKYHKNNLNFKQQEG